MTCSLFVLQVVITDEKLREAWGQERKLGDFTLHGLGFFFAKAVRFAMGALDLPRSSVKARCGVVAYCGRKKVRRTPACYF